MTLSKRLALGLALLLCLVSYSNAQDISTTGNLASPNNPSKWTSGCWTPTQEGFWGGTSGGPCPGIWDNNTVGNGQQIIFSYGQVTLSQTHALAAALPNSGTGLQVNGYNYYWDVKNSNINGNQPGGYDTTAYIDVTLLDASGNSLINDRYNYGYQINSWTTFSGTRTYDNPYSLANADSIRLSVTGKDNQNWAGYYGPEFKWFGLSVNYSVDPCYDNPLYSPTCSGFAAALAELTASATPTDVVDDATNPVQASTVVDTTSVEETNIAAAPVIDAGGIEVSATGELTIPGDAPKETVEQKQVAEEKKEEKKVTVDYSLVAAVVRQAIDLTNVMSVVNQSIMQSTESQVPAGSSSGVEEIALTETTIEQSSTTQDSPVANATMNQDNNSTQTTQTEATQTAQQTTQQQAKKQPNEAAAGGVSMDSFAKTPAGFGAYQTQLADASFYAPKEIYKGQVNVDNRRAMKGLGSDRLHQEMVRQQYGR